jgi:hypothetical protein
MKKSLLPLNEDVPAGVTHAVQYGPGVQTWVAYFLNQHHLPSERAVQIFDDLVHQPVSEATGWKASENFAACMAPSMAAVHELLCAAEVLQVEESGRRIMVKLHGLHVAATDTLTHDAFSHGSLENRHSAWVPVGTRLSAGDAQVADTGSADRGTPMACHTAPVIRSSAPSRR